MLLQELLAYIVVYLLINILYRELLVKRSECGEEEASCREVINIDMHNILTALAYKRILHLYSTLLVGSTY